MPKIMLRPEVLRHRATEIVQCMDDQTQIVRDVSMLIEDIVADWHGEAQKAFVGAFENARPVYEKFAPDLKNFEEFLRRYAAVMEYHDSNPFDGRISGDKSRNHYGDHPTGADTFPSY